MIAHLLVTEGFASIHEVAMVSEQELASIEGFDDDLSKELINRAKSHMEKVNKENLEILKSSGMDSYLLDHDNLSTDQLLKLRENKILTRDQLADLSSFELIEILSELDNDKADKKLLLIQDNIGLKINMEENKDKKENSGKLQLKKTFNVGQIKQSFSHGRTRSVAVEIKKKRALKSPKDEEQNEEKIIKDEFENLQEE